MIYYFLKSLRLHQNHPCKHETSTRPVNRDTDVCKEPGGPCEEVSEGQGVASGLAKGPPHSSALTAKSAQEVSRSRAGPP